MPPDSNSLQIISQEVVPAAFGAESPRAPLELGVVLDSFHVPGWIYYLLEKLITSNTAKLSLVVLREDSPLEPAAEDSPILFRLWAALDSWVRRSRTDALALRDCRSLLSLDRSVPVVLLKTNNLSSVDLAQIKTTNVDLMLNLSGAALAGKLLECAHRGVWSVQGNGAGTATVLGQFWDMFENNRVIAHGPQIIEQTSSGERTLYRSSRIISPLSLALNQNAACWNVADSLVSQLSNSRSSARAVMELPPDEPFRKPPVEALTNVRMAGFLARWVTRTVRHEITKRLFREQWSIALRPKIDLLQRTNDFGGLNFLRPPRDRFYADPFLLERNGRNYLFFEEYGFASRKGVISCCEVDASGNCGRPRVVLERDYHLSYPFLFTWEGEVYMVPESRDNRTIEMYRAEDFPWSWGQAAVLMRDVAATDSTLLHYHDKWWLFTAGVLEHTSPNDTLFLFHADSPLGPWSAHPKNPVVYDPRSARPAGRLYFDDGQLIRPGQDCSNGYGYAVQLSRVDVLSEIDYQETPFARITPDCIAGSRGTHTFNQNETLQVLDSKFLMSRLDIRSLISTSAQRIKLWHSHLQSE